MHNWLYFAYRWEILFDNFADMKVLLLILSLLPWQNLLQEAKQHYMNYENDSCAVKTARVREYCNTHQGETGVLELSADVENVLGTLSQLEGQRDSAALHYRNAYGIVMRTEDRGKASMYCINLADVLRQQGNAPEAAQWLRRALSLSDSLSTHNLDCAINSQLGQVYSDLRNFSMAEIYFEAAEKSCGQGSFDDYFLANARGNACFFNEKYAEAISFFRRASKAAEQTGNEFNVRITEINLGECFLSLHNLDSATFFINASYDFWSKEKYCDESILTAIRGMKAGLALEKGDVAEAGKWLSYGSISPGVSPIYTNTFNRHMMEISVLKGDWKKAYEYSRLTKNYSDSLLRSTLESNFAEAEMRYTRDTTVLKQQARIAEQEAKISRLVFWGLTFILLLVICVFILRKVRHDLVLESKELKETVKQLKLKNLQTADTNRKIKVDEPAGERFVSIGEIVLFTYQTDSRKWQVLLKDGTTALMKRGFRADRILELSQSFINLNHGSIVNMDYIKSIGNKDQSCILVEPFNNIRLSFSRRALQAVRGR